ncbi:hypothetical protein FC093_01655 [Ilyomonas limi]|uniref:UspA domain-containing protein n=1 Tax=Ilyomonas limi TaxID=2575867 RepID=A0A4U3LB87_9BACT|nr:universal stress protein [Ilyomonas limi]TKK71754.1 hypothetical protein FC093_01655 [Ilyomonas limi]
MKTIIAQTDFSDASINAVLFAVDIALEVNATLQIYHAVPDRVVLIDDMDYDAEYAATEEAMQRLETLQEKVKSYTRYRLNVGVQLKYGNISSLLEQACRHDVPFAAVMSATEKTAIACFMQGSETLSVSSTIQVPLLLIPHEAEFRGFRKVAIATDLNKVYDTMPLDILTRWTDAFKPALEIVFVKEDDRFEAGNVSEAVALQTHFEKYYPSFCYIKNDSVANGINTYLSNNSPDLLIVIPKKHMFFHTSISRQFILHPTVPTMILTGHQ